MTFFTPFKLFSEITHVFVRFSICTELPPQYRKLKPCNKQSKKTSGLQQKFKKLSKKVENISGLENGNFFINLRTV